MRNASHALLPVSLVTLVTLWSGRAVADDWDMDLTPLLPISASWLTAPPLTGWGIFVGVHNIRSIRSDLRPEPGQLAAGYVLSGVQLGSGILNLTHGVAIYEGGGGETYQQIAVAVGTLGLVMAAFDLVTTIWAHTRPRTRRVQLAPVAGANRDGSFTAGLHCNVSF